jgi:phage nucleotide-binding protein
MKIKLFKTSDVTALNLNILLYGHGGAGKTTAIGKFADTFGKGLIISGEGGLTSISDKDIDFLPFYSFDHPVDKDQYPNGYSFKEIMSFIRSPEFREAGYKWLAVDSITELSRRAFNEANAENPDKNNNFKPYQIYSQKIDPLIGDLRDLPIHTIVTALAAEEQDDNGKTHFWPMLHQKSKQKKYIGDFDLVCALVTKTETQKVQGGKDKMALRRYMLCDQVHGWHGKNRDPHGRIRPVEEGTDVPELVNRMMMTKEQFEKTKRVGVAQ